VVIEVFGAGLPPMPCRRDAQGDRAPDQPLPPTPHATHSN
jgi:hypothetical protein